MSVSVADVTPLLSSLVLEGNQLTGGIPTALGNLTNLVTLDLGSNQLGGGVPASLGNLTKLRNLYLGGTQLDGPIHQRADAASSVEDRVLAVDVKVDVRRGLGHSRSSVPIRGDGAGPRDALR